ncbi:E3 SUMO-protein ligase KIAA1586-like isoform X2 [Aphis craccivora]|uniref:E3 SUMO-protein ligase KIAA1586-like isoform X2 n=1 Tax=Aphis craccivora TaxID=307492 RepID=A0A6G0YA18_APHCR|nr:E3 SUMO-protein ligase KIAA1586-like isoform X2 [Aphis craccivora]
MVGSECNLIAWSLVMIMIVSMAVVMVEILKHTKLRNKIPRICSEGGTVFRTAILEAHLTSIEHTESVKVDRLRTLAKVELTQCAPLDKMFSNQNSKRALQIAKYVCTVFNDAMRGTLSS